MADDVTAKEIAIEKLIKLHLETRTRPDYTWHQALKGAVMSSRLGWYFWPEEKAAFDTIYARKAEWYHHRTPVIDE